MTRIYLDHAATTPLRSEAAEAMRRGFDLWANPSSPHAEGRAARAALEDARARLKAALGWEGEVIFTGGAASLNNPDGKRVYDSEHFPDFLRPIVKPAIDFLDDLRGERKLNWTFFSPAMNFVVGERRGTFRLGKDEMVYDAEGKSEISYADAAIAMVDELEQENNPRGRFTAAY